MYSNKKTIGILIVVVLIAAIVGLIIYKWPKKKVYTGTVEVEKKRLVEFDGMKVTNPEAWENLAKKVQDAESK